MWLWMDSLDRSREGEDVDVGLAHVGRVVLAVDGPKDASEVTKFGQLRRSQLAAQVDKKWSTGRYGFESCLSVAARLKQKE